MENSKRILVVGAGAIGGYVGGSLGAAGHDVTFLCRPDTAGMIRKEGLRITGPDSDRKLHPGIVETPVEAFETGEFHLLILAVKRYDTEDAVGPFRPFTARLPPILNLQNGIGAEEDLSAFLSAESIIPGTVTTAVGRPKPNEIVVERYRGVGIAGDHQDAGIWAGELLRAGLGARYFADAKSMKWSKLLTNLLANPLSAILDMSPAEIFSDLRLFRLEMLQLREAIAVMRSLGAGVVDLPGTPVRLLAFCANYLPVSSAKLLLSRALIKGRGSKMPSFHGDLHGKRGKSEVGYLHGAVVREGARLGVPTPVNALLANTLSAMIAGEIEIEKFKHRPDRLLDQLGN